MRTRLVVVLALLVWHPVAYADTFTVSNTSDNDTNPGDGSLRKAINDVIGRAGGSHTINITATGMIALVSPLPMLSFTLTITGPGPTQLTIQGSPNAGPVLTSDATLVVSGVTITGASNPSGNGGGILLLGGSLVLRNSAITGNTAAAGGGIHSAASQVTIDHCTISGNTGTGAIFGGRDVTVTDSTIADNTGTAIVFPTPGTFLTITRSTISGNMGGSGVGGIQLQAGTANIHNTTFSDNSGVQAGDLSTANGVTLSLLNVTATGGSAPALQLAAGSTLRNTLLAGTGTRCSGSLPTSQGHNLSSDMTCNLTGATDKPGMDPLLGPLAANGGPTMTHTPLAGSPALNAGDTASLDEALDQRGVPRVQFAVVDIGAVEVSEPVVSTQPVPQNVVAGEPLTLSIVAMNQNSTTPLKYQWRKGGTAIADATSATFTKPVAAAEDEATYDVLVKNDGGEIPSTAVAVTVTPPVKADNGSTGGDGGCCSSTSRGAWRDAVFGLALVAFLGVRRRRRRPARNQPVA